jgi:hypothetical protein
MFLLRKVVSRDEFACFSCILQQNLFSNSANATEDNIYFSGTSGTFGGSIYIKPLQK